jgi:hypothetical protein
VVGRVVQDVIDRGDVLFLGLDLLRPEPPAEDVVAAPVPVVEGAGVGAVEVAHAVRKVRLRRFEDEVVVVPHQALRVQAPAVPALDAAEDVEEDGAVGGVEDDRRAVVPARTDVVEGAGFQMAARTAHAPTVAPRRVRKRGRDVLGREFFGTRHVPGTRRDQRGHLVGGEEA